MTTTHSSLAGHAAAIHLRGLTKRYDDVIAVNDLNLDIEPGEFVTFLGPSGCGKSTSLHMIAGLEQATGGTIRIGGKDVSLLPPQDRDVAMVFQSYALYPHYTVRENIAFPLKAKRRKTSKAEIAERVGYASSVLGLDELLDRYPRELSGGQRQRVALGRATVRRPAAFLLDEPLSNLDLQLRLQTRSELKDLHERLQATMVYVTHDQAEAMVLSNKIVVMRHGVAQQIGTPLECYNNPANVFVAQFLGEPGMNLLTGSLSSTGPGSVFIADGVRMPIHDVPKDRGGPVILGVRPENLVLADSPNKQADTDGIAGTVKSVELLGSRSLLRVIVGDQTLVASVSPQVTAKPGESVRLRAVDATALRLFSVENGITHNPLAVSDDVMDEALS